MEASVLSSKTQLPLSLTWNASILVSWQAVCQLALMRVQLKRWGIPFTLWDNSLPVTASSTSTGRDTDDTATAAGSVMRPLSTGWSIESLIHRGRAMASRVLTSQPSRQDWEPLESWLLGVCSLVLLLVLVARHVRRRRRRGRAAVVEGGGSPPAEGGAVQTNH